MQTWQNLCVSLTHRVAMPRQQRMHVWLLEGWWKSKDGDGSDFIIGVLSYDAWVMAKSAI